MSLINGLIGLAGIIGNQANYLAQQQQYITQQGWYRNAYRTFEPIEPEVKPEIPEYLEHAIYLGFMQMEEYWKAAGNKGMID